MQLNASTLTGNKAGTQLKRFPIELEFGNNLSERNFFVGRACFARDIIARDIIGNGHECWVTGADSDQENRKGTEEKEKNSRRTRRSRTPAESVHWVEGSFAAR